MDQAFKSKFKDSITFLPLNRQPEFVSHSQSSTKVKAKHKSQRKDVRRRRLREKGSKQIDRDFSSSTAASTTTTIKVEEEKGRVGEGSRSRLCLSVFLQGKKIARGFREIAFVATFLPFPFHLPFVLASGATNTNHNNNNNNNNEQDKQRARGFASGHKSNRRIKSSNRETSQSPILLLPSEEKITQIEDKGYCSSDNLDPTTCSTAYYDSETDNFVAALTTKQEQFESALKKEQVFRSEKSTETNTYRRDYSLVDSDELIDSSDLLSVQLVGIVLCLLVLLYLIHFIQRIMTNLLSKILGGSSSNLSDRRRSLASNARDQHGQREQQRQQQQHGQQQVGAPISQSHSSSTLNLPFRNSQSQIIPSSSSSSSSHSTSHNQHHQRRASRSSIHSLSSMLMSAITGNTSSSTNSNNGNYLLMLRE